MRKPSAATLLECCEGFLVRNSLFWQHPHSFFFFCDKYINILSQSVCGWMPNVPLPACSNQYLQNLASSDKSACQRADQLSACPAEGSKSSQAALDNLHLRVQPPGCVIFFLLWPATKSALSLCSFLSFLNQVRNGDR